MAEKTFKFLVSLFLLLIILIKFVQSEPTGHHPFKSILNLVESQKGQSVSKLHLVKQYLKKFGYLDYDLSSNKNLNQVDDEMTIWSLLSEPISKTFIWKSLEG